jgi:hypothetical protein
VRARVLVATLGIVVAGATATACDSGGGGPDRGAAATEPQTTTTTTTTPATVPSPDRLRAPRTAAAAARTLTRVETALRGDDRRPEVLRTLGWTQQLAYRTLGAHPDWVPAVLAAVPDALKPIVQANTGAGAGLGGITAPQATLPDWKILTPKPAEVLRGYYDEAQRDFGIPWAYLAAIHFVETRMGRIHGNSTAGAQGPMQFIPSTWTAFGHGGDINDDHDAIVAAGRYLAATGGPADMGRALSAYNHSSAYVAAVEAYAGVMLADPRAYDGYYQWQVYYSTTSGVVLLPEGYGITR